MDKANDDLTTGRALGAGLGGAVFDAVTLAELLQRVVVLARHTVDGAHSVSITVAENGKFLTSNATEDEALTIDEAQYAGDDGPCLQAMRGASQLQLLVRQDEGRWPRVVAKAKEVGVMSVLSTPLVRGAGAAIGALNIYGREDRPFDDGDQRTAELIGELAAILVENALALVTATELNEQLRHAVASREIIGGAKGIIMERESCTRDEAFEVLRRASQRENRKLRDLAEDLVVSVEARQGQERPRG